MTLSFHASAYADAISTHENTVAFPLVDRFRYRLSRYPLKKILERLNLTPDDPLVEKGFLFQNINHDFSYSSINLLCCLLSKGSEVRLDWKSHVEDPYSCLLYLLERSDSLSLLEVSQLLCEVDDVDLFSREIAVATYEKIADGSYLCSDTLKEVPFDPDAWPVVDPLLNICGSSEWSVSFVADLCCGYESRAELVRILFSISKMGDPGARYFNLDKGTLCNANTYNQSLYRDEPSHFSSNVSRIRIVSVIRIFERHSRKEIQDIVNLLYSHHLEKTTWKARGRPKGSKNKAKAAVTNNHAGTDPSLIEGETVNMPTVSRRKIALDKPRHSNSRKVIPRSIKTELWKRSFGSSFEGSCPICSKRFNCFDGWEASHIKSAFNGGSDTLDNLMTLCVACNRSMRTMNLTDYLRRYMPSSPILLQITTSQ